MMSCARGVVTWCASSQGSKTTPLSAGVPRRLIAACPGLRLPAWIGLTCTAARPIDRKARPLHAVFACPGGPSQFCPATAVVDVLQAPSAHLSLTDEC